MNQAYRRPSPRRKAISHLLEVLGAFLILGAAIASAAVVLLADPPRQDLVRPLAWAVMAGFLFMVAGGILRTTRRR